MTNTEKRVTIATVKSFIRKNAGKLHISVTSKFDGMTDGVEYKKDRSFQPALTTESNIEHTLGVQGTWFVGCSRDSLSRIERDGYIGFHVYNACGSFDIAVKKED